MIREEEISTGLVNFVIMFDYALHIVCSLLREDMVLCWLLANFTGLLFAWVSCGLE